MIKVSQENTTDRIHSRREVYDGRTGRRFHVGEIYPGGPKIEPTPFEVQMYGRTRPVDRVTVRKESLLYGDDVEQVHAFAKDLGVPRGFWHPEAQAYILSGRMRKRALKAGATYQKIDTDQKGNKLEIASAS